MCIRDSLADHPEAKALGDRLCITLANSWPRERARAAGFSEEQTDQYVALFLRQGGSLPFVMDGISIPRDGDLSSQEVQGPLLRDLVGEKLYANYQEVI